jgi:hypothetical protein
MGLQLEDFVPGLGIVTGKGMLGDVLGKQSAMEDEAGRQQAAAAADAAAQKKSANQAQAQNWLQGMKKGGKVKKMAKGGSVASASRRADGMATKGKTKGRMV